MRITIVSLQKKIPLKQKKIRAIAEFVLSAEGCVKGAVSIVITTDKDIRELNKRFMKKDTATDVLSFSFDEGSNFPPLPAGQPDLLGDVVISVDTAVSNAKLYKTTPREELYLYLIHGLLHLLGYDDKSARKRLAMRKRERYYFKKVKNQSSIICPLKRPRP